MTSFWIILGVIGLLGAGPLGWATLLGLGIWFLAASEPAGDE